MTSRTKSNQLQPSTPKTLGLTPRHAGASIPIKKPAFTTPFKAGMKPGEPGRLKLAARAQEVPEVKNNFIQTHAKVASRLLQPITPSAGKGKSRAAYFDLCKRPEAGQISVSSQRPPAQPNKRQILAACVLRPQMYHEEELESMSM